MAESEKTPFHDIHIKNKAKIVEFANYLMPIQFRGMMEEHLKVRSSVGLFDITHMGEFEVWGKDAENFIQKMTTNDVSRLSKPFNLSREEEAMPKNCLPPKPKTLCSIANTGFFI